jgi:hypothetical protein
MTTCLWIGLDDDQSTFSAVKRKFGDSVMSRTDTGMMNETLCNFLCHNLTCLVEG